MGPEMSKIIELIDEIDRCVMENDVAFAPEKLRRELASMETRHGRDLTMTALCQAYVIADRRRQAAEAKTMRHDS
uniref:Uncharacterized protein n=1 Tax=Candidatus Kentrum sp. TC TaxID=2126339 RepID=A0A450YW25_9GAMM|nr:MAG: hypothetical protein BECKTC1821E_GA0114239_105413 [Candidatus Kentron sp. TC]